MSDPPKLGFDVFLSHNSKDKPSVRRLKERLVARNLRVWFDEDELQPGVPWQRLLEAGVQASMSVAVLVGKDGLGPWEIEEMEAALQLAVKKKLRVIPVLLPGAPGEVELPLVLANRTWVDLRPQVTARKLDRLIWGITGQKSEDPSLKTPGPKKTSVRMGLNETVDVKWSDELRIYGEGFVGRQEELAALDRAWSAGVQIFTLHAEGGAGKTRVVVEWLRRMRDEGWRGVRRVFVHSFYSQGSDERRSGGSELFFEQALAHFGYRGEPITQADERGRRLAGLLIEHHGLLVLDGLEPLQHPPQHAERGRLKDLVSHGC
ncbi:MAG TPA: toll/interleukin-1 receptor domain-containing protein [Thermoanaerobaculia bacterium]|jgi:hypothetical protein|nr:toll/interleukin-1 receptor domain-containing protein [Thermoanaerobaculia bacterium]